MISLSFKDEFGFAPACTGWSIWHAYEERISLYVDPVWKCQKQIIEKHPFGRPFRQRARREPQICDLGSIGKAASASLRR
jgi:hypothetical protein